MSDPLRQADATVGNTDTPAVAFWRKEIELSIKREKNYQQKAERVTKLYEGDRRDDNAFNILYSNTSILLPAVYNQLPRPSVDRRYKDPDPLGKLSAQALQRVLTALEDTGDAEFETLDSLLEQAVLGGLVPGRGVTWFRYEANFSKNTSNPVEHDEVEREDAGENKTDNEAGATEQAGPGQDVLEVPDGGEVEYETVCGEDVDFDQFLTGFCRVWKKCPWIARLHYMEKEDAIESFGEEEADLLKYQPYRKDTAGWKQNSGKVSGGDESGYEEEAQQGSRPVAVVYEIWHKEKKQVVFFAPSVKDHLIKIVEDPLELSGFYPIPEPLRFAKKRSKLTPTPLYIFYEEQAKELNRLTMRINRILHALKVRGFYDGTLKNLKDLLNSDDNTLLPASNPAMLREGQTVENSIWMMPLEKLVQVIQQLFPAREQIKNTIYEITGISDIMRGDTQASETATAQNIKNTYGTLRLNEFRKGVQIYARDCLRIIGEIAGKHFGLETFNTITHLDFALPKDIKAAQKEINKLHLQLQEMQQATTQQFYHQMQQGALQPPQLGSPPQAPGVIPGAAPPPPQAGPPGAPPGQLPGQPVGPPPGPPQPPQVQPTPQMIDAMKQAQAILAKPPWEQVVGLLRKDLQRYYRIDIETNSTIASDTQEDKQNMLDALEGLEQIFKTLGPLAQEGALPFPAVKSIVLAMVRRFPFGREVEDQLESMPDQLPKPPPPPGTPTPGEQQAAEAKAQLEIQVAAQRTQEVKGAMQVAAAKAPLEVSRIQREEQAQQAEHGLKMAQLSADTQKQQLNVETEKQLASIKIEVAGQELQLKIVELAHKRQDLEIKRHETRIKEHEATFKKSEAEGKKAQTDSLKSNAAVDAAKSEAAITEAKKPKEEKPKGPRRVQINRGPDGKMTDLTIH